MRILIVTPLLPPEAGGPAYYAVGLTEAFEQTGHSVECVAFREVRQYPSGVRHLIFLYKVLFHALTADMLVVLDTVSVALPAVLAGWVLGKKTLVRVGGDFVWEAYVERTKEKVKLSEFYTAPRTLTRKERALVWVQKHVVFCLAHKVVFSTAWQRDIWREPYGIPESKTVIVENVRATPSVLPQLSPHGRGGGRKEVARNTFLWVGRDLVLKNVDILKKSFEKVKEIYPAMELVLLTGVPREEVEEVMKKARCFVLPSISEVSPNVVFEALSFGTPVICTDDTGIKASAPAGVTFVDTLNEQALTDALLRVCDEGYYTESIHLLRHTTAQRMYAEVADEILHLV